MKSIRLALDWTPNVNHVGFLLAYEQGFYRDVGIDVTILDPSIDNYATTSAKKVELGTADLALCPTESLISYQTKGDPFDLVAIAAVLQSDLSAITVLASSDISRPADLDGKRYASYAARYEDAIVQAMVTNDGGQGDIVCTYPDKLGIWGSLLGGTDDATWIFLNWEGIAAASQEVGLRLFKMSDFGIPYSYSPVVAGSKSVINNDKALYKDFLLASARGHDAVVDDPTLAAEVLGRYIPPSDRHINLRATIDYTAPHYHSGSTWDKMDRSEMATFLNWLQDKGLEDTALSMDDLIVNL
jgi:ABC-type nitrate/sulfonate/bicarbonate transport system substrate-binding protein